MNKSYRKKIINLIFLIIISFLIQQLFIIKTFANGIATVSISAVVLSKSNCRFTTNNVALNFGSINGGVSSDVTTSTTITIRCGGSAPLATFFVSDDDGLYETGPGQKRMRNQTILTEFLPYIMDYNPKMGTIPRNVNTNFTISATISANDIGNAIAGTFTDTVVLSIVP